MLANNLTLDDEEAVQEEFKELQALTVSSPVNRRGITFLEQNVRLDRRKVPNSPTFQTRNPSVPRLQVLHHFYCFA